MTRTLHDIRCTRCDTVHLNVVIEDHAYPPCTLCGSKTVWIPSKVTTDLFGTPQYSDATGDFNSSQREKEKKMADLGYYPKGDKDHGARVELSIKGTGFSFPGQSSRVSTGERDARR
jgi:hypothetical protein